MAMKRSPSVLREVEARIKTARETGAIYLDLSGLSLTSLPESISRLTKLQTLNLADNNLASLPESIGRLAELQELNLARNGLTSLPESINQLAGLQAMDLWANKLATLPESIGQLARLQALGLRGNKLAILPESIGRLAGLQALDLRNNNLASLPESIGRLTKLQALKLADNKLASLPESIGQLVGLQTLDLSSNKLASLPESIGRLAGLQALDLSSNKLASLPESIGRLAGLQTLNLADNNLASLPESIGRLAKLQELGLAGNGLASLPESIGRLAGLQALDLSSNKLASLPESIGRLAGLQALDLSSNKLASLPESIGRLAGLQARDLAGNKLASLPESIEGLSKLQRLFLHGNDAIGLPPEMLGPDAVQVLVNQAEPAEPANLLRYYFHSRNQPLQRLNEAKLLIVGQGDVGKTSLVKRLLRDEYDPEEAKTEGINIEPWKIRVQVGGDAEAEEVRLNIWDFGGQEIMHATHQFFLTKRSLYLVVLDARKGEIESNIHYWLKIAQGFGGDSPVLIVINKHEGTSHLDLDETRLRIDYAPNVRGFVKVSCREGTGIEDLREEIRRQIAAMPHVHDLVPVGYIDVKDALAERAKTCNYLAYRDYEEICAARKVTDIRDQDLLIRFLHDLGIVLNFHDPDSPYQLRDTNILNPMWVTGGVYKILNNLRLVQEQGRLDTGLLGSILRREDGYPPERHRFILDMMRKFEICFEYPDSAGRRYLIPEQLPKNEPELNWDIAGALNFEYHYTVLPPGLISRFIVLTHRKLTHRPTYWRSGVVLKFDGNMSLIRADTENKQIYISILGPTPGRRRALTAIRSTFDYIHNAYPKIGAKEKVPLPDAPRLVVDYRHLLVLEEEGETSFIPEGASKRYDVQDMLNGIEDNRSNRMEKRDRTKAVRAERPSPAVPEPASEPQPARPKLELKAFVVVSSVLLAVCVVIIAVLAVARIYVGSDSALTAISIVVIVVLLLLLSFIALFTGLFGEEAVRWVIDKVLKKVPSLRADPAGEPGKGGSRAK